MLFRSGTFTHVHHLIDVNTLEQRSAEEIQMNEIGLFQVSLDKAVPFDSYARIPLAHSSLLIA